MEYITHINFQRKREKERKRYRDIKEGWRKKRMNTERSGRMKGNLSRAGDRGKRYFAVNSLSRLRRQTNGEMSHTPHVRRRHGSKDEPWFMPIAREKASDVLKEFAWQARTCALCTYEYVRVIRIPFRETCTSESSSDGFSRDCGENLLMNYSAMTWSVVVVRRFSACDRTVSHNTAG